MTQPFDGRRECAVIGAENGVTSNKTTISNPSLSNERPSIRELRCDDCAFTAGTQANSSPHTVLKAQMCAEIPEEFHCHRREGLCAGWVELANKLNTKGYHASQPDWQVKLKRELVEIICRAERAENPIDAEQEIADAIERVDQNQTDYSGEMPYSGDLIESLFKTVERIQGL